ncbi:hypothetical protein JKP88DRAFT_201095 [Tribonema minus]|uniref:Disintegrin domain-containing protein n=1 Tax=Tribonema minus TaxID=303371 RepID=A0A835YY44_9STRA|nr:hypothetical protein JKP88DRAFT_201095 [Tribonema minus]
MLPASKTAAVIALFLSFADATLRGSRAAASCGISCPATGLATVGSKTLKDCVTYECTGPGTVKVSVRNCWKTGALSWIRAVVTPKTAYSGSGFMPKTDPRCIIGGSDIPYGEVGLTFDAQCGSTFGLVAHDGQLQQKTGTPAGTYWFSKTVGKFEGDQAKYCLSVAGSGCNGQCDINSGAAAPDYYVFTVNCGTAIKDVTQCGTPKICETKSIDDNCTCKSTPVTASANKKCRAAAPGGCDVEEKCDGIHIECPTDGFEPSSKVCRASVDACDKAENCTGSSATCPADVFEPSSKVCRPSAGDCDKPETCTGTSAACPTNAYEPSSKVCRVAAGDCDKPENCTGNSPLCPTNAYEPSSKVCRDAAGDCDKPENCTGNSALCPTNVYEPSSKVCRIAAGDCDKPENCTGSSALCPPNAYEPSSKVCRVAAGDCDKPENCTGSSALCPPNAYEPSSKVCRVAAGDCDKPENCTGSSAACPANAFIAKNTLCRRAQCPCDCPELCPGGSANCPPPNDTAGLCTGDCKCAEIEKPGGPTCDRRKLADANFGTD